MEAYLPLIDFLSKAGPTALLVAVGVAVHRKFLVLGREMEQCEKRVNVLEQLATKHADKLEARLDKFEAEREGRGVSPAS